MIDNYSIVEGIADNEYSIITPKGTSISKIRIKYNYLFKDSTYNGESAKLFYHSKIVKKYLDGNSKFQIFVHNNYPYHSKMKQPIFEFSLIERLIISIVMMAGSTIGMWYLIKDGL